MKLTSHILQGPFDLALRAATRRFVKRHHILIACMPKSGSTYLSNAISRLPRFRKTSLVTHYGRTEQDLDLRLALRKSRHNYVCQHHVRYNEKTSDVINRFGVTPIVLVRNVFDCVPSIRDHLRKEAVESPTAYFFNAHPQMSDNNLERMIVQLVIPWYIQFYVSWKQCADAHWVTYDEVVQSPEDTLHRILRSTGAPHDLKTIRQCLAEAQDSADRRNVGLSGRGTQLHKENKDTIRSYCSFYPDVDFSLIGIEQNRVL